MNVASRPWRLRWPVFGIALGGVQAHRTRSLLAISSVAVAVAPILCAVSMLEGMRLTLIRDLGGPTPDRFVVQRYGPADDARRTPVRRPFITTTDIEALEATPDLRTVTPSVDATSSLIAGERSFGDVTVEGVGVDWPDVAPGDFTAGRNILAAEQVRGDRVAVVSAALARAAFPAGNAVSEVVRLGGVSFQIVGVFAEVPSLVADTSAQWVRVPFKSAIAELSADRDAVEVLAVASRRVAPALAQDAAGTALRTVRHLRTDDPNNFSIVTEMALADLVGRAGGMLVGATVAVAAAGLLVGGLGVAGIMLIAVSERTVEIGVRRALGATRADIARQFLVEAVVLMVAGSVAGLLAGVSGAIAGRVFAHVPAVVPWWSIIATIGVAAASGLVLGTYPAIRASHLTPADALRRE